MNSWTNCVCGDRFTRFVSTKGLVVTKEKPIEIINPPNMLKAKIGGPMPALDQNAIARAEAELEKMSGQFDEWIVEEMDNLVSAWVAFEKAPDEIESKANLHRRAHDLKGLAPTYGYPLIGRVCNTLCKLTSDETPDLTPPVALLQAHVDAVRAMVVGKIKGGDHTVGTVLVHELEERSFSLLEQAA